MVKFRVWVHASGWEAGGYENVHFAESEAQVHQIIYSWNLEAAQRHANLKARGIEDKDPQDLFATLLEIIPITDEEFAEDSIPPY